MTSTDRLNGVMASLAVKAPCRTVSTTNVTLSGLQTFNGVTQVEGDRHLAMGQTDATQNGIYDASSSGWTRSKDFDGNRDVTQGTLVIVVGSGVYEVTTANPITIGTSSLAFSIQTITLSQPINVTDYGLVPNDNSTAAKNANTTALKALISPSNVGGVYSFRGSVHFVNTGGSDVYYLNDIIQVRDGIHLDLCGGTLNFSKTYAAADDLMGFLTFIRDVTVENGSIVENYDGTGGSNAGCALRIGSRDAYPFGTYTTGLFDKDDLTDNGLPPMGNIALRNLRITSNNPAAHIVLMLGGLQNVIVENVRLDGQGLAPTGFLYEYGWASTNGSPDDENWSSSHANEMHFRNVSVVNLDDATSGNAALELTGAYSALVDNLYVDTANEGFRFRPGEALFYRPWTADSAGAKRCITLRNITCVNCAAIGIELTGAEAATGYLAPLSLAATYQVDLMTFSLDGFAVKGATTGIHVSGPVSIRNGATIECSNGFIITDECVQFDIDLVRVLDSTGIGIRASFGTSAIFDRKKIGSIRNSQVAGSVGAGVSLDNCESVLLENNRLGYTTAYDASNEATQTSGISVGTAGSGVICRGNYITTSAAAVAYASAGSGDRGNSIENPRGTNTYSASLWVIDGLSRVNASDIADKAHPINTVHKYVGKMAYDQSNTRIMVSQGSSDVSTWIRADGGATVTPA